MDDSEYTCEVVVPGNPDPRKTLPDKLTHHGVKGMKRGVWNDDGYDMSGVKKPTQRESESSTGKLPFENV